MITKFVLLTSLLICISSNALGQVSWKMTGPVTPVAGSPYCQIQSSEGLAIQFFGGEPSASLALIDIKLTQTSKFSHILESGQTFVGLSALAQGKGYRRLTSAFIEDSRLSSEGTKLHIISATTDHHLIDAMKVGDSLNILFARTAELIIRAPFSQSDFQYSLQGSRKALENADFCIVHHLANKGSKNFQNDLGYLFDNGIGTIENTQEALKWFRLAADQGDPLAQRNVGRAYLLGRGVTKNLINAHIWFSISETLGDEFAGKWRREIEQEMSKSDIATAKDMALACAISQYKNCK